MVLWTNIICWISLSFQWWTPEERYLFPFMEKLTPDIPRTVSEIFVLHINKYWNNTCNFDLILLMKIKICKSCATLLKGVIHIMASSTLDTLWNFETTTLFSRVCASTKIPGKVKWIRLIYSGQKYHLIGPTVCWHKKCLNLCYWFSTLGP